MPSPIRVAATATPDPEMAVRELFGTLVPPELAGIVLFCSSRYDLDALAGAVASRADGLTIIGCTSSGELTPDGMAEGTITAIGFPAEEFRLAATCFHDVDRFAAEAAHGRVRSMVAEAQEASRRAWSRAHHAGIFLVDGLSHREEMLTLALQDALGDVPLIGGSSGDGLDFRETLVFHGGRFHRDAAVVAILSSARPLKVFRAQHFRPGPTKMVITGADQAARIVYEINAEPAAAEYARLVGCTPDQLGPAVFASHPPMVRAGGEHYVRAIQSANPDGSLTFYCAIDEGVVLTLGEGSDIIANLETLFAELDVAVGGIDRVLGFDCVLNGIEIRQRQLTASVSDLYARRRRRFQHLWRAVSRPARQSDLHRPRHRTRRSAGARVMLGAVARGQDELVRLAAENAKLRRINAALMGRVERSTDLQGNAFSVFETAIALEHKVRERTADLERALGDLASSNAALAHARDLADRARSRLGDAIEAIDEGFAIFDVDDRLLLCNRTYLSLWPDVPIREGMSFSEIAEFIGHNGSTRGGQVAPDRWVSERVAQHQVAGGGHVLALSDGRWIQVNERRTADGGIVGIYTDITDIKAADAQARARELAERAVVLQATLDTMPQGVAVFDRERTLLAWNGPLLSLLKLERPDARALIASHAAFVDWCRLALPRADTADSIGWLAEGEAEREVLRKLADGRTLEVRRLAMPGGGMVLSFDDVSDRLAAAAAMQQSKAELEARVAERTAELREAKTAAEQANQSKTRFLAAASHDLLQPLNAARLFVSALSGRRMAEPNRALVAQTASALDSIENLLEALLEISKLDAGAIQPDVRGVPLAELFAALKAEFAFAAARRGIALAVAPTTLWVQSDPRLLRRILQNYLSNAVRYTHKGEARMTASLVDGAVVIAVSDTGPGIDPASHAEIFEEFRRLEQGGERGIGLGLAIVQRAGRMLGHPIGLESGPGRGSTFWVAVPPALPGRAAAGATVRAPRQGLAASTILVIDNEPTILEGMRAVLAGWGATVLTARGADDALAAATATPIDLVLADYHLEGGATGDAAVAAVRARLGRAVPAVIITADRTPELRERLTGTGLRVLTKPVKPAQLRALAGSLLG